MWTKNDKAKKDCGKTINKVCFHFCTKSFGYLHSPIFESWGGLAIAHSSKLRWRFDFAQIIVGVDVDFHKQYFEFRNSQYCNFQETLLWDCKKHTFLQCVTFLVAYSIAESLIFYSPDDTLNFSLLRKRPDRKIATRPFWHDPSAPLFYSPDDSNFLQPWFKHSTAYTTIEFFIQNCL